MEIGESGRERIGAIIREVGRRRCCAHFRALEKAEVREKGPNDFVTLADVECEQVLGERLLAAYPGTAVLGEEAVAADPALMRRLGEEKPLWVLDPIDGTINFAHGRAGFASIVALIVGGSTEAGWIHDPLADETVAALRDHGAWSGGKRLAAARGVALSRMIGSAYGAGAGNILAERALAQSGRIGRLAGTASAAASSTSISPRGGAISCCPRARCPGTTPRACSSRAKQAVLRASSTARPTTRP